MVKTLKNIFRKIINFSGKHKIISVILLIVIIIVGYYSVKNLNRANGKTTYVLSSVQKGTIISSVTGSGQTSANEEEDIKPKTSGELIYLGIQSGQIVSKGELIARIDTSDAQDAVQTAQKALDKAKADLEKMRGVETSLGKLRGVKEKTQDALDEAYESGFNTVTNVFLNLPTMMTGLQSILFDYTLSKNSQNIDYYADSANMYNATAPQYKTSAYNSYQTARTSYDENFKEFKKVNRFSGPAEVESIINETYETLKDISTAVKDTINLVQLYQDELTKHNITPSTTSTTHLSSLNSYTNTSNSYLSSLLSIKSSIENDKENLIEADYEIADQEDLVTDKQKALDDANENLSHCYIYAPFNGAVSTVNVKKGDNVSTGTTIAKLVTKDVIAKISLNEIDASKVKIGQKTNATFDAVEGLTLTGKVSNIDTIGTVSQGVVSYNVEITFDTQDERIKPGMSVSVVIIIDVRQDVLMVSNSAVKSKNDTYYVEVLSQSDSNQPGQKPVEIGISDDTNTEIISGLSEGDQVITKTSTSSSTTKSNSTNSTRSFFVGEPGR